MSPRRLLLVLAAALAIACDPPDLPLTTADPSPLLATEPPVPHGRAPSVGRFHLNDSADRDPLLVHGDVSEAMVSRVAGGELPPSLAERLVPSLVWRDAHGLVLAPTTPLDEGARVTLLAGAPDVRAVTLTVVESPPLLTRVWPPSGRSATASYGVFCADDPLGAADVPIALAPSGAPGRLRSGLFAGAPGDRCLRFEADDAAEEAAIPSLPPPVVALPSGLVSLDPKPFVRDTDRPPIPALACDEGEVAFGPGCARLGDDRIAVRSPPRLWSITGAGDERLVALDTPRGFLVDGLSPVTSYALDLSTVDPNGTKERTILSFTTFGPRPHVILNEALFDPLGPEPAQEWIEVFNDGLAPANLGGYTLIDGSGEPLSLPDVPLAPGAFALIAGEAYAPDTLADIAPPPGALIVRVQKLGLSNAGEALSLEGGLWPSRLPPFVHPAAGKSVARLSPKAPDDEPASFARGDPTPGSPNTR